jgi:hypothetical protein
MRWRRLMYATAMVGLAIACSEGTGPGKSCGADVGSVTATVSVTGTVVFDWNPRCKVALLLVEQDASDRWAISVPGFDPSTEADNIISPPITYGQAPAGTEEDPPAQPLVAGQTYELVLWKILPAGGSTQCQQTFQNACLLAVKEFTR